MDYFKLASVRIDYRQLNKPKWLVGPLFFALVVSLGCDNGPPALELPELDPAKAAKQAITDADKNNDGILSKKELAMYPAVRARFNEYNTDNNDSISAEEIEKHLQAWRDRGAAIRSISCIVTLNGKPLPGAHVEFTPEPFLEPGIKPATGVTGPRGRAALTMSKDDLPNDLINFKGVHLGIYKVRITHPNKKISAKYNTSTTLGEEISPSVLELKFHLKSKPH